MAWRQHLDFTPVPFVRQNTSGDIISENTELPCSTSNQISGEEIKSFYEEVVGLKSTCADEHTERPPETLTVKKKHTQHNKKLKRQHDECFNRDSCVSQLKPDLCNEDTSMKPKTDAAETVVTKSNINNLLKAAERGDKQCVKLLLRQGIDVNVTDQYGWTALMCAVKAHQLEIMWCLLKNGADYKMKEKTGLTAKDLASKQTKNEFLKLLDKFTGDTSVEPRKKYRQSSEIYTCTVCRSDFVTTQAKHDASTLHQFNLSHKQKPPSYLIPESNPGFRMMLRSGWNQERGLGPEGQGHKFPIKTVLKRDRKGLGTQSTSKPKITHFQPGDRSAIKHIHSKVRKEKPITLSKRAQTTKLERDRRKEKQFRREFNDF